jgi:tetratricopeptide (TPR) repeat protein
MMSNKAMLSLKVNNQFGDTINEGEPLILALQLTYTGLLEDEQENRIIDLELSELEERFSDGEINEEEYNHEKEELEAQRKEIEKTTLGSLSKPWADAMEFQVQDGDSWSPLDWELEMLYSSPPDPVLELGSDTIAVAKYAMSPGDVEKIREGTYIIKAVISGIESNAVAIGVSREKDESPSAFKLDNTVEFFLLKNAFDKADQLINKMLESDPHSIQGLMLMGELNEARRDFEKALSFYRKAKEEFIAQNPDFWEPPRVINTKIDKMNKAMSLKIDR